MLKKGLAFSSLVPQGASPASPKRLVPESSREESPLSIAVPSEGLAEPRVTPASLAEASELQGIQEI